VRAALAVALAVAALGACDSRTGPLPMHLQSECQACTADDAVLCLDGVDSDEDGLTDCDDPDCAWVANCPWEGEENTALRCGDGLDNDGNGFVDCKDWSCSETTACRTTEQTAEDSVATCSNGLDDDWDGYIDCQDWGCELICQ